MAGASELREQRRRGGPPGRQGLADHEKESGVTLSETGAIAGLEQGAACSDWSGAGAGEEAAMSSDGGAACRGRGGRSGGEGGAGADVQE